MHIPNDDTRSAAAASDKLSTATPNAIVWRSSLRTRLVWLVLVALVPVFLLTIFASLRSQSETVARTRDSLLRVAHLSALGEQQTVDGTQRLLSAIASGPSLKNDNLRGLCPLFLANILDSSAAYSNLGFLNVEGEPVCEASRALDARPVTADDLFRTVMSRWAFSAGFYQPRKETFPSSISFGMPVYSNEGQLRGAVFAVLKLRELMMGRTQDASGRIRVALLDRDGTVLAAEAAPGEQVGEPFANHPFAGLLAAAKVNDAFVSGEPYSLDAVGADGQPWFYAMQAVMVGTGPGLYVVASIAQADVLAPAQQRMVFEIALLLALTACGMAAAYWLGNGMLVRPTQRLLQDMRDLAGVGPPAAWQTVDLPAKDEIKALAVAFEQTAAVIKSKDEQRDQIQAQLQATVESLQATERKLRASQGMLHMASTVSRVGAWQIDMPEAKLVWSPQVFAIYELDEDYQPEVLRSTDYYAPEYRDVIRERFENCVATGTPIDVELQLVTARQRCLWVRVIGEAVMDEAGVVTRVQGAIQDISDQKLAQARELKLARRLSDTLESISEGVVTYDKDWRFTYVNAEAERLIQRHRGELLDRPVWQEFSELAHSPIRDRYVEAVTTRQPIHFVEFYAPLNRWLQMSLYPSDEGLAVYFRDVTQQRAGDAQLRLLEEAVSRITEIVLIAQVDTESGLRIVYVNDAFVKSTGYTRDEVIGKSPSILKGPATDPAELDRIRQALSDGKPLRAELVNYAKSGTAYWVELELVPIKEACGTVTHWVSVQRDVTERKAAVGEILRLNSELEARVLQRTAQLQAVNKELEAFAYSVSHDLRAPLNTINGFSTLLDKIEAKTFSDKGRHYLNRIRAGASQMGELIDGLLVLARNSSETLQRVEVDLTALAARVVRECQEREPEREVAVYVASGLSGQADALLMYVVLHNLIGNAWKFSAKVPAAEITVGSQLDDAGHTVYFVKDNGTGFDATQADKLFGIFQRLHSPSEFAGTGIGLANVKRVVERHDGRVWAHSEVGHGASFYFTLHCSAVVSDPAGGQADL